MDYYLNQFFTNKYVDRLLDEDLAIDGTNGGLLIGLSHDDGGIKVLMNYGYGYFLKAEFEGYEYLFNPEANNKYSHVHDKYNQYEKHVKKGFKEYIPPENIRIIDTRTSLKSKVTSKFLILDNRGAYTLFNKYSTQIYLNRLDELNSKCTFNLTDIKQDKYFIAQKKRRMLGRFWFIKQIFMTK